jgi:N-acetylglucosaminyldiphosphoundecaprenol N-acetyl-beta-D-mannosaminyltransferase
MDERELLLGLPYDPLTMREVVNRVARILERAGPPAQHTALNAAKVVHAQGDPILRSSIAMSDLVTLDGQPVVWAARLLGRRAPERVAGIDLMWELLRQADERRLRVFFLGATGDVVARDIQRVGRELPGVIVAGARDGYFEEADAQVVAAQVAEAQADILFVGMPTPRKEEFIQRHLPELGVRFAMGVGGSFDVIAGLTRRAPRWLQRAGLEWAYRLAQEPRRLFKRYALTNVRFVALVAGELARRLHAG